MPGAREPAPAAPPPGTATQPSSVLGPPVEAVVGLDEAHRARGRAHDDRVGYRAALHVADAVQVVAGRDAGGGAHDRARRQLLEPILPLQVEEAELAQLAGLVLVARLEPRLHLAPDAEEEGRRQPALPRAAHPHQEVDAGVGPGGGEGRRHVAAGDQLDARACPSYLLY